MFDSRVRSPDLIALHRYWSEKSAGRTMPARADFDPVDMAALLPYLFLVDVAANASGPLFRYRLIGTAIVALLGRDSTGKGVDETLHGDKTPGIRRLFTLVCDTRAPVAIKGHIFFIRDRSWVFVEGLLLPLSANGADVNMIMVGLKQVPVPPKSASRSKDSDAVEIFAEPMMLAYPAPIIDGPGQRDPERG